MGRKWAQVENPPFSKNGRQKKKDGGAHRFFEEKKSLIFLISLVGNFSILSKSSFCELVGWHKFRVSVGCFIFRVGTYNIF